MQKKIGIFLVTLILISIQLVCVNAESFPAVQAESVILAASDSEQIIYEKNADAKIAPGSLAKLMTALVAYDSLGMSSEITVPDTLYDYVDSRESTINIKPGEIFKSGDLIHTLLLSNVNDAAIVLALHSGGTIEGFVQMMNDYAQKLGMTNSAFENPTGTNHQSQYTTASDMLKLYKAIYNNEELSSAYNSESFTIPATNKSNSRVIWSANPLVCKYYSTKYFYDYATGGKAATSSAGGSSVITSANKGTSKFTVVILNSSFEESVNHSLLDAVEIFDYAFENYTLKTIVEQDEILREVPLQNSKDADSVLLQAKTPLKCYMLKNDAPDKVASQDQITAALQAPIKKGHIAGTISYSYNDKSVGTVELITNNEYAFSTYKYIVTKIKAFFSLTIVKVIIAAIILFIIGYIALVFYILVDSQSKRKKQLKYRKKTNKK